MARVATPRHAAGAGAAAGAAPPRPALSRRRRVPSPDRARAAPTSSSARPGSPSSSTAASGTAAHEHGVLPKSNREWWRAKLRANRASATATPTQTLSAVGWEVVRVWEHEDPAVAADRIEAAVAERAGLRAEERLMDGHRRRSTTKDLDELVTRDPFVRTIIDATRSGDRLHPQRRRRPRQGAVRSATRSSLRGSTRPPRRSVSSPCDIEDASRTRGGSSSPAAPSPGIRARGTNDRNWPRPEDADRSRGMGRAVPAGPRSRPRPRWWPTSPTRTEDDFQCRGLVLGYVQSGKTTNFTAVIAKAADAGYSLLHRPLRHPRRPPSADPGPTQRPALGAASGAVAPAHGRRTTSGRPQRRRAAGDSASRGCSRS